MSEKTDLMREKRIPHRLCPGVVQVTRIDTGYLHSDVTGKRSYFSDTRHRLEILSLAPVDGKACMAGWRPG